LPKDGKTPPLSPAFTPPETDDWRALAVQVMQEQDPKKILLLVEALNRALDKTRPNTDGAPKPPAK
jgi:hypothetical protein